MFNNSTVFIHHMNGKLFSKKHLLKRLVREIFSMIRSALIHSISVFFKFHRSRTRLAKEQHIGGVYGILKPINFKY